MGTKGLKATTLNKKERQTFVISEASNWSCFNYIFFNEETSVIVEFTGLRELDRHCSHGTALLNENHDASIRIVINSTTQHDPTC